MVDKKRPKAPDEREDSSGTAPSGRRKLLKALLGAGAVATGSNLLPDKWTKPIIDTVILPAHAGFSPDDDDDDDDDGGDFVQT